MPAYLVSCDLFKGDRDNYEDLYKALKRLKAVRATESVWYVASALTAIQLRDRLRKLMHEKDVLTVDAMKLGGGHASYGLSQEALAWKKRYLVPMPIPPKLKSRLPRRQPPA